MFILKTNSIAFGLQYFIGLRSILCYVNFQVYMKWYSLNDEVARPGA
jgi:hypothetical protein